jgi:MgsA AAA+ ATPase C terminal
MNEAANEVMENSNAAISIEHDKVTCSYQNLAAEPAAPNGESTNVDSRIHWLESVNTAAINLLAKTEKLKRTLAEIAPLLEGVQEGFQKLRDKANLVGIPEDRRHILGCKSFQEFIDKKLGVTKQAVYKALETWEMKKEYGIPADQPLPSSQRKTGEPSPAAGHDSSANSGINGGSDSSSVETETDAGIETATSAEKQPQKSRERVYMHHPNAKIGDYYRKDMTSWFHKALRRGDEDAALFCASEFDWNELRGHVWNTLIVTASEDVGLADNNLTVQLLGLFKSNKAVGNDLEMARDFLVRAVLLVARAIKSRVADEALCTLYGNAIPEAEAESLLVEVVKLEKEGRSGEAWNKMRPIARTANAEVSVQVHALYEHWKHFGGKEHEASEDGAQNRIFFVHAALICARAEKTRQTERIYADRAKRDLPDYAKDYHSWTGKKELGRTRDSAEGVRHFLEEGAKLENEDTSPPNPYRPYFLEWIWSKVKKSPGSGPINLEYTDGTTPRGIIESAEQA